MEFPEIHFGGSNKKLHYYNKFFWNPGETRAIEFYPNLLTPVTLYYTSEANLLGKLSQYIDGNPISIDLEWSQPSAHSQHPIELFQFASSKGVVIVASHENKGFDQIASFLHSTSFFGKGMSNDNKKLFQCCHEHFDIEDIEHTRLVPNNLTINFESLTDQFLGPGTAQFKDHKVQRSNWSLRPLTILQILYGAHDAYSMLLVYHKLVEQYGEKVAIHKQPKNQSKKKVKNQPKEITVQWLDLDSYLTSRNIQLQVIDNAEIQANSNPTIKDQVVHDASKKKMKFTDENDAFLQNAKASIVYGFPRKSADERRRILTDFSVAVDLIFSGIVLYRPNRNCFRCQRCERYLPDSVALLQHVSMKHIPPELPDVQLDIKELLTRFLNATNKVVCPIQYTYDPAIYKSMMTIEEDENDHDEEDSDDLSSIQSELIVPLTYNPDNGIKCNICNMMFSSIDEINDHCWINHYEILFESLQPVQKKKESPKIMAFSNFCVNNLKVAHLTKPDVVQCNYCDQMRKVPQFFIHLYFDHPSHYVIVTRNQCIKWPLRYEEFDNSYQSQMQLAIRKINYQELEDHGLFSKSLNKCVDCDVVFHKGEERDQHYVEQHMIYFPLLLHRTEAEKK